MVDGTENDDALNLPAEKSAEEEADAVNKHDDSALFEVGDQFVFYSIDLQEVPKYEFEEGCDKNSVEVSFNKLVMEVVYQCIRFPTRSKITMNTTQSSLKRSPTSIRRKLIPLTRLQPIKSS